MSGINNYIAPRSLDEAAEALRAGNVTLLAGGTDLMPQSRSGRTPLRPTLMNIRRIPELRGLSQSGGTIRIGALTTITELRESAFVRERLQALWQACDSFASDQVRNAATIGGNMCNASPAGDTLVPLLVLDAQVELASKPNGALSKRALPLADFLLGPGQTARAPTELLSGIVVTQCRDGVREHLQIVRRRVQLRHERGTFGVIEFAVDEGGHALGVDRSGRDATGIEAAGVVRIRH